MTRITVSSENTVAACRRLPDGNLRRAVIVYLMIIFYSACLRAGEPEKTSDNLDSLIMLLPDLEVRGEARSNISRNEDGGYKVRSAESLRLTRAFGEADLIGNIKSLAGVERGSDYGSGVSADGRDPSQMQYLVDGVPVIFPFRFGGIFSTFNTPHFSGLAFSRQSAAGLYPRLGGAIELESALRTSSGVEGSVNVGIISSSATVRTAFTDRISLSLSARTSYIDQLYGRFLSSERNTLGFAFTDCNATLGWRVAEGDMIRVSFLHSSDRVLYDDSNYLMATRLNWHNTSGGISWTHEGDIGANGSIWVADFADRLSLDMTQFHLTAPASFLTGGARISIHRRPSVAMVDIWEVGTRVDFGKAVPQHALLEMSEISGINGDRASERSPQTLQTWIGFGRIGVWLVPDRIRLNLSLSVGLFRSYRRIGESPAYAVREEGWWNAMLCSPVMQMLWKDRSGDYNIAFGFYQQPLHQVGFSELGLASDFTIGAARRAPVQTSLSLDVGWRRRVPLWKLDVGVEGYWSRVRNQVEYRGRVLEVVDNDYDPFRHLIVADGHNLGGSLNIGREFGPITGSVSYGYSWGRRHKPQDEKETWRALHAGGHTLKASLSWHPDQRWTLAANYVYSSGRPYTPVKEIYIITGNIAMAYGKRNSARLPAYSRLDIGATYMFPVRIGRVRFRNQVNLSLLNALGHRNVEMQYFTLSGESYELKRLYSLYRFIPSLSYTLEF